MRDGMPITRAVCWVIDGRGDGEDVGSGTVFKGFIYLQDIRLYSCDSQEKLRKRQNAVFLQTTE